MCILCQQFTGTPDMAEKFLIAAYIDPGVGFVFSSAIPFVFGAIATALGSLFIFIRKKIAPFIKRYKLVVVFLVLIFVVGTIMFAIKENNMNKDVDKKIVILGLDGLDPKIIEKGFGLNLLPNLKHLSETGSYSLLQTTTPPQSPVAWASFMTGTSPSKHGVFDFIKRDPKTYLPDLVFSNPKKNPILAKTFWEITSKYNIPTTVLFLPDTFPAPEFKGKMISGMGTPDVLGTEGSFTLFSTIDYPLDPKWRGRLVNIPNDKIIKTEIPGPKFTVFKEKKIVSLPFEIEQNNDKITINVQNQKISLKAHEFSPWVKLEFSIDFFTKIKAIARFYVRQTAPGLEIYLSPLSFDPNNPVYPIASPRGYAKDLANNYGLFSTLGLPHDTWALEENIFDDDAFLKSTDDILEERKKIILGELKKFNNGLFFGYFGVTDTIQHMYWRTLNDDQSKYQNTVLDYYRKVDDIVGQAIKTLRKDDVLIVLSDHGFDEYNYEININTWLKERGYLVLREGAESGRELMEDVDWTKTRAYSIGYNGIYLNIKDREGGGIVEWGAIPLLEKEISGKLMQLFNPETGGLVMKKVYTKQDLGISSTSTSSPDLYLGYYKGARSSWDTAVGATPKDVIVKRKSKWSGDHLFDASEIPGVLFTNKKFEIKNAQIIDIIPTVLKQLGIVEAGKLDGKSLW